MASKGYTLKKGVCGGTSMQSVSDVRASFLPGVYKINLVRGISEKITASRGAII
jgi:hypothetical protein